MCRKVTGTAGNIAMTIGRRNQRHPQWQSGDVLLVAAPVVLLMLNDEAEVEA
jgi:hypothetical protein